MTEAFLAVFNASISASYVLLAVLLVRLLLKKAPKWITVLAWGLVGVRLLFPFSIESVLSLIPSSEVVSPSIMTDKVPAIDSGIPIVNETLNPIIGESFSPAVGDSANPLGVWIPVIGVIWLIGVIGMLIYTAVSYASLKRRIGCAVLLRENIYQSERVTSPFILGIIKPKIYIPFRMTELEAEHVISHEKAHLKRKDHLWKPLGFLLLALHWFNPLMWLGYVLLCRDIELACDEKVIRELDPDARADYSEVLLSYGVGRKSISACPVAFGEVSVKSRVKSVLNYKKPAFWLVVAGVIACIAVAVFFLTDPPADKDTELGVIPDTRETLTEYDGVYATLKSVDTNAGGHKVFNVIIHNDTDKRITYGEIYGIERKDGEEWTDTVRSDVAFLAIGIYLPPHESVNKSYSTQEFDISKPGTYRLAIPFSVEEGGKHTQYHTYIEFDVASVSDVGGADKPENTYTGQLYFQEEEKNKFLRITDQGCDIDNVRINVKSVRFEDGNVVFDIEWINSSPDKLVIGPDFKVYKYDDQEHPIELKHNNVWRYNEISISGTTEGEQSYDLGEHFTVTKDGPYRFEAHGAWVEFWISARDEFDSALFDIDGDGTKELCTVNSANLSGLVDVKNLYIIENDTGIIKYISSPLWLKTANLKTEEHGALQIHGVTSGTYPETVYYDVSLKDGNLLLNETGDWLLRPIIPSFPESHEKHVLTEQRIETYVVENNSQWGRYIYHRVFRTCHDCGITVEATEHYRCRNNNTDCEGGCLSGRSY